MGHRRSLIAALAAGCLAAPPARAADAARAAAKESEAIAWVLSAPSRCPKADADGRWLDGSCVQLVTKVTQALLQAFVPSSSAIVQGLLEVIHCERGPKSSGATAPFLAACVERKGQSTARQLDRWREARVQSPNLPTEVPEAPLPKANGSLFPDK